MVGVFELIYRWATIILIINLRTTLLMLYTHLSERQSLTVLVIRNNCKEVIVCICVSDRDELTKTCSVGSDKLSIVFNVRRAARL